MTSSNEEFNHLQHGRNDKSKELGENVDIEVLRKEYRNMQANRNAFARESDLVLRRQQTTLQKLRAENETLKADVARLQSRHMTRPINPFEQSQLDHLYEELDRYTNFVETEKTKGVAIEKEIAELREEIGEKRKQMGGTNALANNQKNVEKQVRLLESRLDQALTKFNKCVSRNKRLREEIDGLRGERVTFEKVYKKIEKDLRDKKEQMALLIEHSNQAYEQRDKALLEIAAIEQANRKDENVYHQQMNELSDEIEKLNEQLLNMTKRNQQPVLVDPAEEERKLAERKDAARAYEIARVEEEYAQQRKELIENFEEAFRKISEATGISDVDELVQVFIKNEEYNFSLLRYMNEQSEEIERLNEEVKSLHEEAARYKADKCGETNDGKDEVLKIENKIKVIDEQTVIYDNKYKSSKILFEEVKEEIKLLLIKLDCQLNEEGGEISLTSDNVLHYLGLVEERAIAIVSNYSRLKETTVTIHNKNSGKAPSRRSFSSGLKHISINPPKLVDYSSDESSGEGEDVDSSQLKPVHRADINGEKLISRASVKGNRVSQAIRWPIRGRRGSLGYSSKTNITGKTSVSFLDSGVQGFNTEESLKTSEL